MLLKTTIAFDMRYKLNLKLSVKLPKGKLTSKSLDHGTSFPVLSSSPLLQRPPHGRGLATHWTPRVLPAWPAVQMAQAMDRIQDYRVAYPRQGRESSFLTLPFPATSEASCGAPESQGGWSTGTPRVSKRGVSLERNGTSGGLEQNGLPRKSR